MPETVGLDEFTKRLKKLGENTVVWEPDIQFGQPGADSAYSVQLNNVRIDGVLTSFSYEVIIFDPN